MNIIEVIRRGLAVRRYHQRYTAVVDTVGSHSAGVACIVLAVYSGVGALPRSELLAAALTHDLAEQVTGDIPSPVKKSLNKSFKHELCRMEEDLLNVHGLIYEITEEEHEILKFADNLDGLIFCCEEIVRGNLGIAEVGRTYVRYLDSIATMFSHAPSGEQVSMARIYEGVSNDWNRLTESK